MRKFLQTYLPAFLLCLIAGNLPAQWTELPEYMWADSARWPFYEGVASADPLPDRVLIWTRCTLDKPSGQATIEWECSTDSLFRTVLRSGTAPVLPENDHTVTVDVTGLEPATTYYYRFSMARARFSQVGRTRTAPVGAVEQLRFAVASCSSVYSGFFNAYRRMGERKDLDLVIHLGDNVYDFVDEDEQVRVPKPYPERPRSLDDWRKRRRYYLLDPDLRYLRSRHPWMAIWDNHDVRQDSPESLAASLQAFREYNPMRDNPKTEPLRGYRRISYGNLVEVFLTDILLFRGQDSIPGAGISMLGNAQWEWLQKALRNSTAKWKLIGTQNMVGTWSVKTLPEWFPYGNGEVADPTSWDGFPAERDRVLSFLENEGIDNVIFLTGDSHVSMLQDLARDPLHRKGYDPKTGRGSVAVEFLPTSITRGNFDEQGPGPLAGAAEMYSRYENPHCVYTDFTRHGYGLLEVRASACEAQFWYSDIRGLLDEEVKGAAFRVREGENHWDRGDLAGPVKAAKPLWDLRLPEGRTFGDSLHFAIRARRDGAVRLRLWDLEWGSVVHETQLPLRKGEWKPYHIRGPELGRGRYRLELSSEAGTQTEALYRFLPE